MKAGMSSTSAPFSMKTRYTVDNMVKVSLYQMCSSDLKYNLYPLFISAAPTHVLLIHVHLCVMVALNMCHFGVNTNISGPLSM